MRIENEHTFKKALSEGINLFAGAGFSVLANDCEGRPLPIGSEFAAELLSKFDIPKSTSLDLSKISTILEHDKKSDFYAYIKKRFDVKDFDERYFLLDRINIKTIFTTNVDNLMHEIYSSSSIHYLNDVSLQGPAYSDRSAIDFVALHGSILNNSRSMSFSSRDVAAAFRSDPDRWHALTNQLQALPTIFWGHGIEDAAVLEALNPSTVRGRPYKDKWMILQPSIDEGTIRYFKALDFQIIIADTIQMLDYLDSLKITPPEKLVGVPGAPTREIFPQEAIPDVGITPVRPIIEFYLGAAPSWNDIFNGRLHRTCHFTTICNVINSGKNTIAIGLPACGKTTLMMQVAAALSFSGHKLICDMMTSEKAHLLVTKLCGEKALIFLDNFTDSINAFRFLSSQSNVQIVGFDRDYNFDIVSHKINKNQCTICDVTELSPHDMQEIFSRVPRNIKKPTYMSPETSQGIRPSLFELIEANIVRNSLRDRFYTALQQLAREDINLLDLLLVCCYVHKCRTPISMDMLIAFFRDKVGGYRDIYRMHERLGAMLTDYVGELADEEQDYFIPRSNIVAEAIIDQAPSLAFKRVLQRFHKEVSPYRIHRIDVFRRQAYDKDLILKAFPDWEEGMDFYRTICDRDPSPFVRQQCALYLSFKKRFTEAFEWIDDAIMQSAGKIPSIRNSHAIILFKANIDRPESDGTVQRTLKQSMDILSECYHYDKRKTYHALVFADQALKYCEVYPGEIANEYLATAKKWLEEETRKSPWHRNTKRLLTIVSKKLDT
jgi:hypothetical protein